MMGEAPASQDQERQPNPRRIGAADRFSDPSQAARGRARRLRAQNIHFPFAKSGGLLLPGAPRTALTYS